MFSKSNQFYKKRKRRREINFEVLERIKNLFNYTNQELADLLSVSISQLNNYRKCGRIGADRVIALKQSLELLIEDEAREKRKQVQDIILNVS